MRLQKETAVQKGRLGLVLVIGFTVSALVTAGQLLAAPGAERGTTSVAAFESIQVPASVVNPRRAAIAEGSTVRGGVQPVRSLIRTANRDRQPARAAAEPRRPGQAVDVLEDQKFEDAAFPPPGWKVLDVLAQRAGKPEPDLTWSRETCDVDRANGGVAAAWSHGGGNVGKTRPPCGLYTAPIDSRLIFDNIDTSNYLGGLRVSLRFKMDTPRLRSFQICAPNNDSTSTYTCQFPQAASYLAWTTFTNWLVFPKAAELTDAEIAIIYQDDAPDGTDFGAYIDNFHIEGIYDAATPVASPTPRATVTPRRTPTLAPRPSSTPTATPSHRYVFLPIADRDSKSEDRLPAIPTHLWVEFGTSIDKNTGIVGERGTRFAYGTMRLCGKTEWSDLPAGSKVGWVWQYWDGGAFVSYEDPPYKDSEILGENRRYGFRHLCIGNQDSQGQPAPIDVGKFRIIAALNDVATASETVEIVAGAPTATRPATDEPTPDPDATLTPEPEPTDGSGMCRQRLVNGNFEGGPGRGWSLRSNSNKGSDTATVIIHDPQSAVEGEWLALLGGGVNVQDELHSSATIALFEPDKIISASLTFAYAMDTEETKNGSNDDVMAPFWQNQDSKVEQVPNSGISEEILDNQVWYRIRPIDVTSQLIQRTGWTSVHLLFFSQNSAANRSVHAIDDVKLTVCTPASAATAASRVAPPVAAGAGGGAVSLGLPFRAPADPRGSWLAVPHLAVPHLGAASNRSTVDARELVVGVTAGSSCHIVSLTP